MHDHENSRQIILYLTEKTMNLWVKMPSPSAETSHRHNFNEYELVQEEVLKNLGTTVNIEQTYILI